MSLSLEKLQRMYRDDKAHELASTPSGLRFLLLKSLDRPEYATKLGQHVGIDMSVVPARARLKKLFESRLTEPEIRSEITAIYLAERNQRKKTEKSLVGELYKMKSFDWGGLHQNSLEKTIVDNYVKKIDKFDQLNDCIDTELLVSLRGYVQCSWYNHWTSILIEDIFKDHPRVTPAVGLIKKIDFFIGDLPFDLKVTYLPEGYVKEMRRNSGLRPELTLLKRAVRIREIEFDNDLPEGRMREQLWSLVADIPDEGAKQEIGDLEGYRRKLVEGAERDPTELIRWLYENQGIRRFDASNRLFLVLVNNKNYFDSWKLKRAHTLLEEHIGRFLSDGTGRSLGRQIKFDWEGSTYAATSALLIVQHSA